MKHNYLPLFIIVIISAILVALVEWSMTGDSEKKGKRPDKALVVEMVAASVKPMPFSFQVVGKVESEHSVEIRPQVSGVLQKMDFAEGAAVKKGQRLFRIDSSQYETALIAARAEWEYTTEQAQRLAPLAGKEYVTTQEYDTARASVDQALAKMKQAEINMAYTDIRAPVAGRTGNVGAKPGNRVSPGDSVPLVVINQMQPILVQYNIPQQLLSELRRYQSDRGIKVFITEEDGSGDLGQGELVFVDNAVNTETGTVQLKARVENKREQLWPGQYVGVRTQLEIQNDALVIPQTAIQTGQSGNFVYVVEQGSAVIRDVKVARQVDDHAVIASGLKAGEIVVTRAPGNLRPGVKVSSLDDKAKDTAEKPKAEKHP